MNSTGRCRSGRELVDEKTDMAHWIKVSWVFSVCIASWLDRLVALWSCRPGIASNSRLGDGEHNWTGPAPAEEGVRHGRIQRDKDLLNRRFAGKRCQRHPTARDGARLG